MKKNAKLKNAIIVKGRTLILSKGHYANNGNLAIAVDCTDGEPWSTLTVNLGGPLPEDMAFIDSNNNSAELIEACEKAGYIKPSPIVETSGFCTFRAYWITLDD